MEPIRKPFQGVYNIIRFNWHFYFLSFGLIFPLLWFADYFSEPFRTVLYFACFMAAATITISLLVSYYVYDLSGLYILDWLNPVTSVKKEKIINIHAGFDETSLLLQSRFPESEIRVLDFYDPKLHTEISIKRARKAYPSYPGTISVSTSELLLGDKTMDMVFVIFSAHEIRNKGERIGFFKEIRRVLKYNGQIVITEHLRDLPNFLAYSIGFFHFHSRKSWLHTFNSAGLMVSKEIKITPFITTFILEKNGIAS